MVEAAYKAKIWSFPRDMMTRSDGNGRNKIECKKSNDLRAEKGYIITIGKGVCRREVDYGKDSGNRQSGL